MVTWTAGAGGVAAGTVVTISGMSGAATNSSLVTSTGSTTTGQVGTLTHNAALANASEVIYAISGNLSGTTLAAGAVFLAAIGNSSTNTLSSWTTANGGVLTDAGLTLGTNAIGIRTIATAPGSTGGTPAGSATVTDTDIGIFNASRSGQTSFAAYLASINNPANWIGEDGTNDQSANGVTPEAAMNATSFTIPQARDARHQRCRAGRGQ